MMMKKCFETKNLMNIACRVMGLLIACQLSFVAVSAQGVNRPDSVYASNMKLGKMFQQCGNTMKARACYETAIKTAYKLDLYSLVNAQLSLVDVIKFQNPVEAQRLNDNCMETSSKYPDCRQRYLALNGIISFLLGNKESFNRANDEYISLSRQNGQLPSTYDKALQALNDAINGYYDTALKTLNDAEVDQLTRHDLRIAIFGMSGDSARAISELQRRALTIDSLNAIMYEDNINENSVMASIERVQQQAEQQSSRLLYIIVLLALLIVLMIIIWLHLQNRKKKDRDEKNYQLQTALKMAGETERMKEEFVRRISHEIRTPLNSISGFNDILNNSDIELSKEEREDLVARINENIKAITYIVDELLQMANDKSTQDYNKHDEVLVNQFFSDLLYSYSSEVKADIRLSFTTHVVNRDTIVTNVEMVKKMVEHLIHNAIKFTQQGSIELECYKQDGMLCLTLTDTGCGIPAEKQDEVFKQFSKADANQQGIGLGLTVSRNMARKLGGDLVLDKDYTDGARFTLKLPTK